ncbi:MAG: response regulator, partial [Thiobacillaceae bacterium]
MRLLLAEDDAMLGASIEQGLRRAGFIIDWVRDGQAAELALADGSHDLLLLDLGLPRMDGLTLLKRLRQRENAIPVLIVTARDAIDDRVTGLNLGADDYLIKPFDLNELIARVHALLRRRRVSSQTLMRLGALELDPITREVRLHGCPLHLTAREYSLLYALMERPGATLSIAQLETRLYGWGEEVQSNAVEVHLHH